MYVALGRVGTILRLGHKSRACPHTCGCARCLQCPSPLGSLWRGAGTARAWCPRGSHLWAAAISRALLPAGNPASRGVCPQQGTEGFLPPLVPSLSHPLPQWTPKSLHALAPVSDVPFHPRDTGTPLFPCPQSTLAGIVSPCQVCSWAGLTEGRRGKMEASAHPCPLEAPFCAAPGELARAQGPTDPRAYLPAWGFCGFVLAVCSGGFRSLGLGAHVCRALGSSSPPPALPRSPP